MPGATSREFDTYAADLRIACSELALARGQFADARAHCEEAVALTERIGDEFVLNNLLNLRAEIEFVAGNASLAAGYSEAAAKIANGIPRGSALLARALCLNAGIRLSTPDVDGAEAVARRAFKVTSSIGDDALRLISLQNLAALADRRGRPHAAARLLGAIEAWREATEYRRSAFEQATHDLLLTSLVAQLGDATQTHIVEGKGLPLEAATDDVLSLEFHEA
jgi:tetratricopeptide (TPR) repeat protein